MDDFNICDNYQSTEDIDELMIGYAKNSYNYFIVIPIFSIIANILVIITYIKKRNNLKLNQYYLLLIF